MKSLFEPHLNLVGKVLDMQLERQNVVASNIANLKTPGYRARKLEFEKELQEAMATNVRGRIRRTDPRHLPGPFDLNDVNAAPTLEFKPKVVHGEDRVDLDKEMALMAKTTLQYTALTSIMRSSFEGINKIITEGQK